MSANQLLDRLTARGVHLSAAGGRLRVDSPAGTLKDNDRRELAEHKAELLKLLASSAPPATGLDQLKRLVNDIRRRDFAGRFPDSLGRVTVDYLEAARAPGANLAALEYCILFAVRNSQELERKI
jgi:hypothetical protein